MSTPAARCTRGSGLTGPHVAVIERHGKFTVAEPFFGPGPRLAISRDKRASVGDLVVVRREPSRGNRGGGRAMVVRRIGRPDVARDVIEALMLDRGLRRTFDPAVAYEARGAAARDAARDPGRRDLRELATFTIDPAERARLRRRHLRFGPGRWELAGLGSHRRRRRACRSALARGPRGLPAQHERLCPRRGRADAARGAVEPRLLARARRGPGDGDGGDGARPATASRPAPSIAR